MPPWKGVVDRGFGANVVASRGRGLSFTAWLAAKARLASVLLALLGLESGRAQQPRIYPEHAVPELLGDSLAEANGALEQAGLARGDVQGPQAAEAQVIGQSLAAGTPVRPGTVIALTMGLPRKSASVLVTVPALDGLTRARALSALSGDDLRAGDLNGPLQGTVTLQRPAAGDRVKRGTAINLTFALRLKSLPDLVTVPMLEGKTKAEAAQVLSRTGLAVGSLVGPPNSRVNDQLPEAGSVVHRGTPVDLSMAEDTLVWVLLGALVPLLAVAVWLVLKRMHPGMPAATFSLVAHHGALVYSPPMPQAPQVRFSLSLRDHVSPPTFVTAAPPTARPIGEGL